MPILSEEDSKLAMHSIIEMFQREPENTLMYEAFSKAVFFYDKIRKLEVFKKENISIKF